MFVAAFAADIIICYAFDDVDAVLIRYFILPRAMLKMLFQRRLIRRLCSRYVAY